MTKSRRTPEAVAERRRWWAAQTDVPYGLCWCGCGKQTSLAVQTDDRAKTLAGEPRRYLLNHHGRRTDAQYKVVSTGFTSPCWLWLFYVSTGGYGQIHHNGKLLPAHQLYYERLYGPVAEGLELDHLCRVRHCVNPKHLEPVPRVENVRRGAHTKLSLEQASEIRSMYARGQMSQRQIADQFGVQQTTISRIVLGQTWRDSRIG